MTRSAHLLPLTFSLTCAAGAAMAATTPVLNGGSFISKPAAAEQAAICPTGKGYPAQFTWAPSSIVAKPGPATSGKPLIEQYRGGKLIAVYTSFDDRPGCTYKLDGTDWENPGPPAKSGCGPFTHSKGWRLWAAKDVFLVYPAVYSGQYNNFSLDYEFDQPSDYPNNPVYPTDITIAGVVQNNTRPVVILNVPATHNAQFQSAIYFGTGTGNKMSNIDVYETKGGSAGVAGVYVSGSTNLTLQNMRISGFETSQLDGLFVATAAGILLLDQVELDHNGGNNNGSLGHNAYVNASQTDTSFLLDVEHSWFHNAYLGSLFKDRAARSVFTANYFEGGLPQAGQSSAELYLLDVPNGGAISLRDNIFTKNETGATGNGAAVTFAVEGVPDSRPLSIDIENNTFVGFSAFYTGTEPNYPFFFYTPAVVPGTSAWPSTVPYRIIKNAFVGYCPNTGSAVYDYRGTIDVQESFSELAANFALSLKLNSNEALLEKAIKSYIPVVGSPAYGHVAQTGLKRKLATIGAED